MDATEFRKDFLENVKSEAAATGEGSSATFVNNMALSLVNAETLPDFTPSFYAGAGKGKRKYRVDGYALDEFDLTMNLVIADYDGNDDSRVLTKTTADQDFGRLLYFLDQACGSSLYKEIEMSTPCADLVDLLHTQREHIRKYKLIVFTDATMSSRIESLETAVFKGVPVEYQIWDIARLFKISCCDGGRQPIEINFKAYTVHGIPCLEASRATAAQYNSYLCVIPGTVLADIHDKYGSLLLEGNVRSFLSTKVAVNKKIRETILKRPGAFFAYNNGISTTARDVGIEATEEGKFVVFARDFQIINGGQTTVSLSNTRYKDNADLRDVLVQMKLTEIDEDGGESAELIANISRSSNTQNKVSDADFFSTHPFHIRMEQFSRKVFAPAVEGVQYETKWFYERARGQYLQAQMRMTPAQKRQFVLQNPKNQVVTKTDLAKVHNTWRELPQTVSKGAQASFMEFAERIDKQWKSEDARFGESYFQESMALFVLFKHTENLIPKQPWYEQGYRANIVTYSLALLHCLIEKQFPGEHLDLMAIWSRQSVPSVVTRALETITGVVFHAITDPKRETINVTQWCKRDACWTAVKKTDVVLPAGMKNVLTSREEVWQTEREEDKILANSIDR